MNWIIVDVLTMKLLDKIDFGLKGYRHPRHGRLKKSWREAVDRDSILFGIRN
jgi:hypothetical protein